MRMFHFVTFLFFLASLLLSRAAEAFVSNSETIRFQRRHTQLSQGTRTSGKWRLFSSLGQQICEYHEVKIPTSYDGPPTQKISVEDLTPIVKNLLKSSGVENGTVTIISRHTTTSITINERESRLARDIEECLVGLVPPDERSSSQYSVKGVRYQHNDIFERPESEEEKQRCRENGWNIDNTEELDAWRAQEPINAHSHLLSMLLGSSESIPVVRGELVIGQWQSILLVDLDGPRERTVGVQILGFK